MRFNHSTNEISFSRGDWGVPIRFESSDFAVGDEIRFCFSPPGIVSDKSFAVAQLDETGLFKFDLRFNKAESAAISSAAAGVSYKVLHIRADSFSNTVLDGKITVRR